MKPTRKYILKPGKHQFAPGSPAVHDNDNITDDEAKWYIEKYPHIKTLFVVSPEVGSTESPKEHLASSNEIGELINQSMHSLILSVKSNNEDLSTTN